MLSVEQRRAHEFQQRIKDDNLDLAVLTDPDSIAYLAGFWNYLGVEFGRPTVLVVPADGAPQLITPLMEFEMAQTMSWVEDIRPWEDAGANSWQAVLSSAIGSCDGCRVGIERQTLPALVSAYLGEILGAADTVDTAGVMGDMRRIKDEVEIDILRQAGQVAVAMAEGGCAVIAEGVPEYEVSLAVIAAGTRKAAEFLKEEGIDLYHSPMIHNLQILQSGPHTCMVHRRPSVRRVQKGEPFYMCFCGITKFKNYKLGFDREYFVGHVDGEHARIYETAVAAQQAALAEIRPGVLAEEVSAAADEVYRSAGFEAGYRTGRAFGFSFLEQPELKAGDKTPLAAGMAFAVDGGITVEGEFGARVGDSIVVTDTGFEYLTDYSRDLTVL